MKHSVFEERLIKQIKEKLPGAAPGVIVQVYQNGRKVCDVAVGDTHAYYDLASLTKIIFTTQAMMRAFSEGRWTPQTKVKDILSWFPHEHVHIYELLNHSSGLKWWAPFYKDLDLNLKIEDRWKQLNTMITGLPLEKQPTSVYSDLGFLTLASILCEFYQKSLFDIWTEIKENFYPRLSLEFHLDNQPKFPVRYYAQTGKCPWRGRIMQGEVQDENAWALGGVSTHAGLFGSIDDVGWFGLFIRGQLQGISRTLIKQKTAQLFASRSLPLGKGDWALGYMMPTRGQATCGDHFSPDSIGHTGYTGTSFWYDPTQDLIVVVLSNRLAFGRENEEFKKLRPLIHNWIVEGLRRS
jgi:CubicO group peptidase (beta-lactamase class C family)